MSMPGTLPPFGDVLQPPRTLQSAPRSLAVKRICGHQKISKVNRMRRDRARWVPQGMPVHYGRTLAQSENSSISVNWSHISSQWAELFVRP